MKEHTCRRCESERGPFFDRALTSDGLLCVVCECDDLIEKNKRLRSVIKKAAADLDSVGVKTYATFLRLALDKMH